HLGHGKAGREGSVVIFYARDEPRLRARRRTRRTAGMRRSAGPGPGGGDEGEVAELDQAMEEAGGVAAGGPVGEVDLVLADPVAGADGVDGHPDLHAEAAGEREDGTQGL